MAIIPLGIARPFVGVLMWDWIAFMNPHQLEWGFGSDLPWAAVAFAVTMIGWFASRTEPKRLALNPTALLMLAFMAGITVTSWFALGSADAVWSAWSRTCKIFLFLIVTMSLLTEQRRIVALVWLIVICLGYFVATQGLLAVMSGGEHKAYGPPNSMLTDNNEFAAALLVVLPLMNFLRLHARHGLVRIGLAALMCLTLLTILASYSRGAVIGLGVVALLLGLRSRRKLLTLLTLGGALAAAVAFMPTGWFDRSYVRSSHTIEAYQADESAMSRLYIWRVAWTLALRHPFTGAGFHATTFQTVIDAVVPGGRVLDVHGVWLQVLGEQGFVVFAIWLSMMLVGLLNARWIMRRAGAAPELAQARDLARMAQIAILGYAVSGTFLPLAYWDVYFTILAIVAATRSLLTKELVPAATAPPVQGPRARAAVPRPRPVPAPASAP